MVIYSSNTSSTDSLLCMVGKFAINIIFLISDGVLLSSNFLENSLYSKSDILYNI